MTQTIYLDVYFGFNFLMDFLVLLILGIIIKTEKHIARTVISAIIGGIYATIVLMLKLEGGITYFLTYMIMAEVLIIIAFGRDNLKTNLRNIAILYSITFLLNGLLNLLYFNLENKNIVQGAQNTYYGKTNIFIILLVGIMVCVIVKYGREKILNYIKRVGNIYTAYLFINDTKISATALRDTGNSLIEPVTKKPVSIIEEDKLAEAGMEDMKYIFVPYNTVGKSHGLMKAFVVDKLVVNDITTEKAIIGIYKGKLSQSNKYEMILNPDILNK